MWLNRRQNLTTSITYPANVTRVGTRLTKTASRRRFLTDGADLDGTQTNDMWICACSEEKD